VAELKEIRDMVVDNYYTREYNCRDCDVGARYKAYIVDWKRREIVIGIGIKVINIAF
jgi:hypothetical protein